ncbi:sigma-54-dependent transcriptional regulator [Stieleria maiorica]|uniref:sigma-54-dependent transcriptional regulator n=1 Tax=Stieleria maiorica TaxID=2795974 RepID=UPI0036F2B83A
MSEQFKRILIADDEPLYRDTTAELLRDEGYECICVNDANGAIDVLHGHSFDLILSDLNMPGNLKLELLKEGRTKYAHIPMIVVTGVPSVPSAIESVRLGIADYLLKPIKFEELLAAVCRAIRQPVILPREPSSTFYDSDTLKEYPGIIGRSQPMFELLDLVGRVAASSPNILITGESGTGKEVIAKAIHDHSPRADHPIQVIDCTAVPESLFESVLFGHVKGSFTGAVKDQKGLLRNCDGGTAFFDELGELPHTSQAKLLRVIQEQTFTPVGESRPVQVDTRFICATNRDLQKEVDAGRFRQDLFYRLAVIHLDLPPLRKRGDDVVLLAAHFLNQLGTGRTDVKGLSPQTLECFRRNHWPGNIRELRNVMERAIALARGTKIEVDDLPRQLLDGPRQSGPEAELSEISRDEALDYADRECLAVLLQKHDGVIASAARQAGLSRQGLNKLLKRHGICVDEYR